MNQRAIRARNWCYTLNSYTEEHVTLLKGLHCRYHIFGKEIGESGNHHIQGFICFKSAQRFTGMKEKMPRGTHLEVKRGSFKEASDYCCKDDKDPFIYGERPLSQEEKGQKSADMYRHFVKYCCEDNYEAMLEECPGLFVKHVRSINAIQDRFRKEPEARDVLDNLWWYGDTGTGKSRGIRELFKEEGTDYYIKNVNKWNCHYKGEHTVLIEDISPENAKYMSTYMKTWTDHYVYRGEYKGGSMKMRPKRIAVTSNYSIRECFPCEKDYLALERRFKVKVFKTAIPQYIF